MSTRGYLFDTNIWLALALGHHPHHAQATAVFLAAAPDRQACFCWATRIGVLRLLTTEAVFRPAGLSPMTNRQTLTLVDGWTAALTVGSLQEPPAGWTRWRDFADLTTASPKRWMDAYLAAFALETGLQLVTVDEAFTSYPNLDPLVLIATTPLPASPGPAGSDAPP